MASAYSQEQIEHYLDFIDFPAQLRKPDTPRDLAYLTALHIHQISKIPYDNLSLHYSKTHQNSLDPQVLFDKFTHNGRGGYCMETAVFYRHVLKALGFRTYIAGARIRFRKDGIPQGPYIGWVHCTNVVTLENGDKYSCDVGFGGDGATKPVPLKSGHAVQNLGSQEIRLLYDSMPEASEPDQKVWIYQYRNSTEQEWNSFYAFPEFEFFQPDLEAMNYWTSNFASSFQRFQTLVVKFLRTDQQIVGKVMLADAKIKRNMGGKTEIVKICREESERVKALKQYFDIDLTEEEVEGIRGLITELKATEPTD